VRAHGRALRPELPAGVEYSIPFDATVFVDKAATRSIARCSRPALLVLVVILVFLQNWRAVLIPATTVPVTLIGAFAFMAALGFSINLLTLFGLVLGDRHRGRRRDRDRRERRAPHRARRGAARGHDPRHGEVTGPVIGITAVLMAVFLPAAFLAA
jgi:HAE1 family hydrophobic/amphiphilic exporter-1